MSTNQAQYFECFKNGFDFIKNASVHQCTSSLWKITWKTSYICGVQYNSEKTVCLQYLSEYSAL